jgi:hypothetical protein
VHAAAAVSLRHFLMEDPAARRHPLHISGPEYTLIAQAVSMADLTGENIRYRLDTTVWMPREARNIIVRIVILEVIEKKERIEFVRRTESERAAEPDPGSFDCRSRLKYTFYGP